MSKEGMLRHLASHHRPTLFTRTSSAYYHGWPYHDLKISSKNWLHFHIHNYHESDYMTIPHTHGGVYTNE